MDSAYIFATALIFIIFVLCIFNNLYGRLGKMTEKLNEFEGIIDTQRMLLRDRSTELHDLKYKFERPPLGSTEKSQWTLERSERIDETHKLLQMLLRELKYEVRVIQPQPQITKLEKVPF